MSQMPAFHWQDPLLLDQQLSDEERLVQQSAAQFAADKLAPRVLEAFRHEQTDPAIFREMGETGLLGATIPEQYGGSGLNRSEERRVGKECISRGLPDHHKKNSHILNTVCHYVAT